MEINATKIAQVIIMARELSRGESELRAFLDRLSEDEQAELVAVMWVGRGSFDVDDLAEAIASARQVATTPTADYLIGTPHVSDHLEAGLEALGINAAAAEDDLL